MAKNLEIPILEQQVEYWEASLKKAKLEHDRASNHLDEVRGYLKQVRIRLSEAKKSVGKEGGGFDV